MNDRISEMIEEAEKDLLPIPCPSRLLRNKTGSFRYHVYYDKLYVSGLYYFFNQPAKNQIMGAVIFLGPEEKPVRNLIKFCHSRSFVITAYDKSHPLLPHDIVEQIDNINKTIAAVPDNWDEFKAFCESENIFYQVEHYHIPKFSQKPKSEYED